MERILMKSLLEWKNKKDRKPLILYGARQVGKTWLMKAFGEKYFSNLVYISFYNNKTISRIFEEDYDSARIIRTLEIETHTRIIPEETLLIFDEIQNAPKALESLKYFCEENPEYCLIAAGSLLGVALHEGISFPVGKVDELYLHPMSFEEFLLAIDERGLYEVLLSKDTEMINQFSDRYIKLLKEYYIVGGMPEIVNVFLQNHDYDEVREKQLAILNQYEGDFGKHISPKELPRIKQVWNAIPLQLSKENKKFFFGQIKEGARQKEFELAIQWLVDSGLITKVNKVTKPSMPLKAYIDFSAFKLFFLDVGLLCALSELDIFSVINGNDVFTEFKGALTEQYVLQQIRANTGYTAYYYSGEKSTYKTDFMIQQGGLVVPVEVKAEENIKSKSLKVFIEKYNSRKAIRISMNKYRHQEIIENIPLWACGKLL